MPSVNQCGAVAVMTLGIGFGGCASTDPAGALGADSGPAESGLVDAGSGPVDAGLACVGGGYPRVLADTVLLAPDPLNFQQMFISADGTVIAGTIGTGNESAEAFRWTASSGIVRLGSADGYNHSYADGMSADGSVVVGSVVVGSLAVAQAFPVVQAFRWTEHGGFAVLGSPAGESSSMGSSVVSADGTMVAGWYGPVEGQVMFRWTQTTGMVTLDPPGAAAAMLTGLSADGSVAIGQTTSSVQGVLGKAFRWKEKAGWSALDPGTAYTSAARLVNADGSVIVGTARNGWEGEPITFRWKEGSGLEILSVLAGQTYSSPAGISADGSVIVGAAYGERPYRSAPAHTLAFRWTEAAGTKALERMPHPASVKSWNWPALVSAAGTTVIGFDRSSSDDAGLITDTTLVAWDEQGSPQPIRFCLLGADGVPVEVPPNAIELMAMSASGAVVAGAYTRGANRYGWIAHLR